jgi:hypothetical protein
MTEEGRAQYDAIALSLSSLATSSQMFGMPALKVGTKAFAGFHHGSMVFKLRGDAHAEALSLPGSRLFDPSGRGRPMREWVEVPAEHAAQWPDFAEQALQYVADTL